MKAFDPGTKSKNSGLPMFGRSLSWLQSLQVLLVVPSSSPPEYSLEERKDVSPIAARVPMSNDALKRHENSVWEAYHVSSKLLLASPGDEIISRSVVQTSRPLQAARSPVES